MARLRRWACYRDFKRPYTRYSKYKKFSFIKARPANRISRYTSGKMEDKFTARLHLVTKQARSVRDNALESARQSVVRNMDELGKTGWFFQIRAYPHNIVRENPLAAGAGADRLSTGMKHSFGKPVGVSAQLKKGQEVFTIYTSKQHVRMARNALKKAAYKLPFKCSVTVEDLSKPKAGKKTAAKKAVVKAASKAVAKSEA